MLSYSKIHYLLLSFGLIAALSSCRYSEEKAFKSSVDKLEEENLPASERVKRVDSLLVQTSTHFSMDFKDVYRLYTIKRDAFIELNDTHLAVETNDKTIQLAQSLHDTLTIAQALTFHYLQDIDKTFFQKNTSYYPSILSFTAKSGSRIIHGRNIVLYAYILMDNAKYAEAEKQYLDAERVFRRYNSEIDLIKIYLGLGSNMLFAQGRERAGFYYTKALNLSRKIKNNDLIASSLMNLAITKKISHPDSALKLYNQALTMLTKPEQDFLKMKVKFNISNIYRAKRNYTKTEQILKEILTDCINQNFTEGVSVVSGSLGLLYAELGQLDKSVVLLESSKRKTDSLQLKSLSNSFLPDLIDVYTRTNQFEKAFRASQELISQRDSSISIEKQKAILDLESKFTAEIKDIENAQLARVGQLWEALTWGLCIVLFFIVLLYFYNIKYDTEKQKAQLYLVNYYQKQLEKRKSKQGQTTQHGLSGKLTYLFLTRKPFTNPAITATELANTLHVSEQELDIEIRARGFQSFEEFIHFHRIQEARLLFESKDNNTIETILQRVGFTSKKYFNLVFEEVTGLKSDYYIRNIVKN